MEWLRSALAEPDWWPVFLLVLILVRLRPGLGRLKLDWFQNNISELCGSLHFLQLEVEAIKRLLSDHLPEKAAKEEQGQLPF